jgi:hypothetical protein
LDESWTTNLPILPKKFITWCELATNSAFDLLDLDPILIRLRLWIVKATGCLDRWTVRWLDGTIWYKVMASQLVGFHAACPVF